MFSAIEGPRLFGLPPGADAAKRIAEGLIARAGLAPDALADVLVVVNTARMRRRLIEELAGRGPRVLPRIVLIEELAAQTPVPGLPPAAPRLRRRLELTQLVAALLRQDDRLAPRAHLYDLADTLNALIEEMHGEGVAPSALSDLEVGDQSAHWERSLRFLLIAAPYFEAAEAPDVSQRLRVVGERLAAAWEEAPPRHPIVFAGSTGSRGATARLMRAVARLPQGALILPGYDFDLPVPVWGTLDQGPEEGGRTLPAEDHPQYRFHALLRGLEAEPDHVVPWDDEGAPDPGRARIVSLALRPAPVTDGWLSAGPALGPLAPLAERMTLLEAPAPREEAVTIALGLRAAAVRGLRAALVTPDRTLARRVAAMLGRWGIVPDDSAGVPLHLSPPGRLLRQIARLSCARIGIEPLIALLKHPLTHSDEDRTAHLRRVRRLEYKLRREGPPYPSAQDFADWAETQDEDDGCGAWCEWLGAITERADRADLPLEEHVARHVDIAVRLAGGPGGTPGRLWEEAAGVAALTAMEELAREAAHGGTLSERDYADLLDRYLAAIEVRRSEIVDTRIRILGTQEARIGGVDLAILGGLNDGTWPAAPDPDPWLNRALRQRAGLPLPERRIGLMAHDFQQAANAPEVWFTRSVREGDPTTRSRLLSRILNLLDGLPETGGRAVLAAMRAKGAEWLRMAEGLDLPTEAELAMPEARPAPRPAPAPPIAARPQTWSPSAIRTLIRDPYAIYAGRVLRLPKLHGLRPQPDAALRGTLVHEGLRAFVAGTAEGGAPDDKARLLVCLEAAFAAGCDWPAERRAWLAQAEHFADWFLAGETERAAAAALVLLERKGEMALGPAGTLRATADRIDLRTDGTAAVFDYKTGQPPREKEQKAFEPQLLIEAMMIEAGAWPEIGAPRVAEASYLRIGRDPRSEPAPIDDRPSEVVKRHLLALLEAYREPDRGFPAALALRMAGDVGDYDHLARRGEWGLTEPPVTERVG